MKFLSHSLVSAVIATIIGLIIEYNFFQSEKDLPNPPSLAVDGSGIPSTTMPEVLDSFLISDAVRFQILEGGVLRIQKKVKNTFLGRAVDSQIDLMVQNLQSFETYYSPVFFVPKMKITVQTTNGEFFETFKLGAGFSDLAFSSFTEKIISLHQKKVPFRREPRNTIIHGVILFIAILFFIISFVNRVINRLVDNLFKSIESIFK